MRLHCLEVGEGPGVLILHGLFGQARNWAAVAKGLADDYRLVSVDLPNHGRSPWTGDVSYPSVAAGVAGFMTGHELEGAAVVGHSMGGKVAMALALTRPDLVGGLVVVDIAPVPYAHGIRRHMEAMQALPLDKVTSRESADRMLAGGVDDPAVRALLLSNLAREEDGYAWRINLDGLHDGADVIHGFPDMGGARYEGRTLFVAGETSDFIGEEHKEPIGSLFPNAEHAVVKGAGHWVHADKPEETIDLLRTFLAG